MKNDKAPAPRDVTDERCTAAPEAPGQILGEPQRLPLLPSLHPQPRH